jgi:ubiquinone/menaquinone biosynthesis C-methylase UbiE
MSIHVIASANGGIDCLWDSHFSLPGFAGRMAEENMNILTRQTDEDNIVEAFSRVARFYNVWSRLTESKAARKEIEFAEIRDGERILEVALGTGLVFAEILRQNKDGETFGVDISPAMVTRARKHLKDYSHQNYHLQIGSAYRLPFDSNNFDLLMNNFMLDLLPEEDFATVLREFHRLLKPGGIIVLSTMTFGRKRYNRIWLWIAKRFPSLLTGCRPVETSRYLEKTGFEVLQTACVSQNTFPSEILKARKTEDRVV